MLISSTVENPALPAAGEASPTIRPLSEAEGVPKDTVEADDVLSQEIKSPSSPTRIQPPPRPPLKRESSNPAPPLQPPPPAPASPNDEAIQDAPDSLTLAELKRIRSNFPNAQPPPEKPQLLDFGKVYDFEYHDAQSLPVEVEEWFSYSDVEFARLRSCQAAFNDEWRTTGPTEKDWIDVTEDVRRQFVSKQLQLLLNTNEQSEAVHALLVLTYIGLGVWEETAGRQDGCILTDLFPGSEYAGSRINDYKSSSVHLQWIVAMVDTLHACDVLQAIYTVLQTVAIRDTTTNSMPADPGFRNEPPGRRPDETPEMWCCLTLLYMFVEVARATDGENATKLRRDIAALEPSLLICLTKIISTLRWEEALPIPLTKMLLLSWKTILVTIGGIKDVEHVKSSLRDAEDDNEVNALGKPLITASPLDYHLFRQEISSKYPAYQPPQPLFPLEPESNTILPPLKHRRPSYASSTDAPLSNPTPANSIMHQPVHIATPAPSPPPSPAGPGKAGKKQNYQTNQMFPFLYPPLDGSSNDLGGKGTTELQDLLVGRKWEGSDIPASIIEAAELFAKRMRATRAMKQLWQVRVEYMKQERGWKTHVEEKPKEKDDGWLGQSLKVLEELKELGIDGLEGLEDLKLDEDNDDEKGEEDFELIEKPATTFDETAEQGKPLVPPTEEQRKLDAVENFYQDSLQHIQSVVIVLLKAVLQNVTDLVTKNNGQNGLGLQAGIQFSNEAGINGVNGSARPIENGVGPADGAFDSMPEELDHLRSQEIAAKALSAIILLLLKWFKVNHILQYEYLSQLLMDSNYLPLILKLWQTQEIGRACHYRLDKEDLNFFAFCKANMHGETENNIPTDATPDSEDEAIPPPIKRNRSSNPLSPTATSPPLDTTSYPPEVDELGYATTPLPPNPIKTFSHRNIFTHINYLRILQKLTRRKTQRALMLINYKSSNHLKKSLKIPVELMRYYTLKIFKSQVPFCGRKWRQGNMKIITAVWLSVPAELRDDWLSGGGGGMGGAGYGDVDGAAEDAIPMEQGLRALTFWWNVRRYGDEMGKGKGVGVGEEMGFFERELEKMGVGWEEDGPGGFMEDGVPEGDYLAQWSGPEQGY